MRKVAILRKRLKNLKYCRKVLARERARFNCKDGSGWTGCPVRSCCVTKGVEFCFECSDFPCANWNEKGKFSNVFNSSKKKRLQEMKEVGVEQWVKNQWKWCALEEHKARI